MPRMVDSFSVYRAYLEFSGLESAQSCKEPKGFALRGAGVECCQTGAF
jgi:hypothetical protein